MCSGCSGDYYGDFNGQERFPEDCPEQEARSIDDEGAVSPFRYGNLPEELEGAADFILGRATLHGFSEPATCEEYEIFVSESQITEIRILQEGQSVRGYRKYEDVGVAWEKRVQACERSRSPTAKCYRTLTRARLVPQSWQSASGICIRSICLAIFAAVFVAICAVAR